MSPISCSFCPTDAAMAAAFPYRGVPGGMPPGVPPPAPVPVPDYMTEEKLQEKGDYLISCGAFCASDTYRIVSFTFIAHTGAFFFFNNSKKMATAAGEALLGEEEIRFCGCSERGHAS